jgi:glycosyltransferase involved in cell wall biosynthesis
MRIGYLSPQYLPVHGGVERHVSSIARCAVAAGHDVEVITQTCDRSAPATQIVDGVFVRRFRSLSGSGTYGVPPGLFAWLAREGRRFDVIHAHGYHAVPALAALTVRDVPVVFTPHYHGDGHTHFARALHVAYRPLGRRLFDRSGVIVCVSGAERGLVTADFPRVAGRIQVIPNGVDARPAEAFAPFPRRGPVILSVGRLAAYKRVDLLVEAVSELPADVRLVVVGDGPGRGAVERTAAELGIQHRVDMVGRVSDGELARWLATADVVASLSLHEAFGITLAEGAAAGAAVVASDIAAHAEVAELLPKATLVPVAAGAWEVAGALRLAINGGRPLHAAAVPSWDDVAGRTIDLYHWLIETGAA